MSVQWSFALFKYFCLLLLPLIYFVEQMIGVFFCLPLTERRHLNLYISNACFEGLPRTYWQKFITIGNVHRLLRCLFCTCVLYVLGSAYGSVVCCLLAQYWLTLCK